MKLKNAALGFAMLTFAPTQTQCVSNTHHHTRPRVQLLSDQEDHRLEKECNRHLRELILGYRRALTAATTGNCTKARQIERQVDTLYPAFFENRTCDTLSSPVLKNNLLHAAFGLKKAMTEECVELREF
ncbi:hypothetical protein CVV38_00520 [Candidatus Peregrinibacteria bacterium HGW-Peregrinibacteria-1]|jgi:hypothetical protein|nr:MAG: hypothetical protein CVV38_00520 [Candidatus Peregrinibacteria bacterium HGW-Peregrinibacteria-1]